MLIKVSLYKMLNGGCCDYSGKSVILHFVTSRSMTMTICKIFKYAYSDVYRQKKYIKIIVTTYSTFLIKPYIQFFLIKPLIRSSFPLFERFRYLP